MRKRYNNFSHDREKSVCSRLLWDWRDFLNNPQGARCSMVDEERHGRYKGYTTSSSKTVIDRGNR